MRAAMSDTRRFAVLYHYSEGDAAIEWGDQAECEKVVAQCRLGAGHCEVIQSPPSDASDWQGR